MSLYMPAVYWGGDDPAGGPPNEHTQRFHQEWARTGKQLDMGKSCIRFKKLDDLALDVIARAFERISAAAYVEYYESTRAEAKQPAPARKSAASKAAPGRATTSKAPAKKTATKKTAAKKAAASKAPAKKTANSPRRPA